MARDGLDRGLPSQIELLRWELPRQGIDVLLPQGDHDIDVVGEPGLAEEDGRDGTGNQIADA